MKYEFPHPLKVLHLEDSELDQQLVARMLEKTGWDLEIFHVDQLPAFSEVLQTQPIDIVLADYKLPGFTAMEAWQILQGRPNVPPFILLSGAIGETAAVEAIKMGLSDYLDKADLSQLPRIIERSLDMHHTLLAKARADAQLARSEKRLGEFTEHLQSTIERERASIAREIHDDIGGSLAAGVPKQTTARFRAYDSYEASFKDYARMISQSPRYAKAREQTSSAYAYASGLQQAGYATDPEYANKLSRAINSAIHIQRAIG